METLVIETDAVRRRLLEKILEQHGHTAVAHSSVEAALGAHDRAPFPLVLTSRRVGPTDGLEVCRQIRARPSTFLIVLAWEDAPADVQAVFAAGADDYVAEPTRLDLLSLRVAFATRQIERAWASALTVRTVMAALDHTRRTSEEAATRLGQIQRLVSSPWDDAAEGIPIGLDNARSAGDDDIDGIPFGCEQTSPVEDTGGIPFGFAQTSPCSPLDDGGGIPMGFEHTPHAAASTDGTHGRAPDTELARTRAEGARVDSPELRTATTHEIRAPAQAVSAVIRHLLETDLTPEQRELAEKARRSVETQLEIADGIIDASRLDSGQLTLASMPFDLRVLVDEVVAVLEPDARAKGIELTVRHAHAAPRHVIGDARRLRQILLTLAGNAVAFTSQGQVLINVRSEERTATDARFRITVTDSGPGLAEDALARLLGETDVTSAPRQTRAAPAMSLAICQRLVELMGGRIGATSEPGTGSTFWVAVRLPVIGEPEISDRNTKSVPRRQPPDAPTPIRARVLVAEGDPLSQTMATRMLAHLGCIVDVATTGPEAVLMLAQHDHDIVFIDGQLAETGSLDVIAEARRHAEGNAHVSIIVVSRHDDRERWLGAGVAGYLRKPVTLRDLRAALARWCSPPDTAAPARGERERDTARLDAAPPPDASRVHGTPTQTRPGRIEKTDDAPRSPARGQQVQA
jgi:CheY-like chemotaxis protein